MRTIIIYLSTDAASLEALDEAFQAKLDEFLVDVKPLQVLASDNSTVHQTQVNRDGTMTTVFQSDREYRITLPA